jgi:hypothetical protein
MIADGLPALEARLAHDLAQIALGGPDWTHPRDLDGRHVYDAVIVGGGRVAFPPVSA